MTPDLRAYVLGRPVVRVADVQREFKIGWNVACAALEDLESDRLIGRRLVNGIPEWSATYQVDEDRVAELRIVYGKSPRLVGVDLAGGQDRTVYAINGRPVTKRRAEQIRRHVDERHPGTIARCARCARNG